MSARHLLWINEVPRLVGGCERYILNTVHLLRERGLRASFLYEAGPEGETAEFLDAFDSAEAIHDLREQVGASDADLVYLHRFSGAVTEFANTNKPVARFFHDHHLFCLRKHKYTAIGHHTCTKPIGFRCYPCLGFVNRADNALGLRFDRVGTLRAEHRAHDGLDAFIVGSSYMADHVAAHGFDRAKIHAVPLYATPQAVEQNTQRENDLFLFVGQLLRGKGLDILLDAMARTKRQCRLLVIGTGRQKDEYVAQAQRLGLSERVTFGGQLKPEEVALRYAQSTCVVMPSRNPETFGLVGPEAMSHETPVIATAVGGAMEWLEHEVTGLGVPPNDARALARALDRIIDEPELARELGAAGKRCYEERFRPEHHVDRLLSVFDRISSVKESA